MKATVTIGGKKSNVTRIAGGGRGVDKGSVSERVSVCISTFARPASKYTRETEDAYHDNQTVRRNCRASDATYRLMLLTLH